MMAVMADLQTIVRVRRLTLAGLLTILTNVVADVDIDTFC